MLSLGVAEIGLLEMERWICHCQLATRPSWVRTTWWQTPGYDPWLAEPVPSSGAGLGSSWQVNVMCHSSVSPGHSQCCFWSTPTDRESGEGCPTRPQGACCSDRFGQEGAPKNSCWKEAEQAVDGLQILHAFLISRTERCLCPFH